MHELAHLIWPALQVTPTPPVPDGMAPTCPVHPRAAISATVGRHPPSREASFPKRVGQLAAAVEEDPFARQRRPSFFGPDDSSQRQSESGTALASIAATSSPLRARDQIA